MEEFENWRKFLVEFIPHVSSYSVEQRLCFFKIFDQLRLSYQGAQEVFCTYVEEIVFCQLSIESFNQFRTSSEVIESNSASCTAFIEFNFIFFELLVNALDFFSHIGTLFHHLLKSRFSFDCVLYMLLS